VQGNYASFQVQNGSDLYWMLTNSGDQYGTYNSLRPLYINLASGNVTMSHAVTVGGVFTANGAVNVTGALAVQGMVVYGGIPISGNPGTTAASHNQKCIIGSGGVTINGPAHVDGTCLTFYANGGAFPINNNETMFWYSPSGGTTGNRTLADRGIATALKISGGHWVISGNGLT
jgi:hypothetical protein